MLGIYLAWQGGFFGAIGAGGQTTCDIPSGGGSCTIEMTLPFEKAASSYSLDLSFDSILGPESGGVDVAGNRLNGASVGYSQNHPFDESTNFVHSLYALPSTFPDVIEELRIRASIPVYFKTTGTTFAQANLVGWVYKIPAPTNKIERCDRDIPVVGWRKVDGIWRSDYPDRPYSTDGECSVDLLRTFSGYGADDVMRDEDMLAIGNLWPKGQPYLDPNQALTGTPLITDETFTLVLDETITPPVKESNDVRFIISQHHHILEADARTPMTLTWQNPQSVQVWYKELEYPTDMAYKVGNIGIDTLAGTNDQPTTTVDFADQINQYCNRDTDDSACTVPITFTSANKGGKIVIEEENEVLIDSVQAPPPPPQSVARAVSLLNPATITLNSSESKTFKQTIDLRNVDREKDFSIKYYVEGTAEGQAPSYKIYTFEK